MKHARARIALVLIVTTVCAIPIFDRRGEAEAQVARQPTDRWEYAELRYSTMSGSYWAVSCDAIGLEVRGEFTGNGGRRDVEAAVSKKTGQTGHLANQVAMLGWEPFAVESTAEGRDRDQIYHFRRVAR